MERNSQATSVVILQAAVGHDVIEVHNFDQESKQDLPKLASDKNQVCCRYVKVRYARQAAL